MTGALLVQPMEILAQLADEPIPGPTELVALGRHAVDPMPCPRPRGKVGQRSFMPKRYVEYADALAWSIRKARRAAGPDLGEFGVALVFDRATKRVADLDNCQKAFLDAATGVIWENDKQVSIVLAMIRRGRSDPATLFAVWRVPAAQERLEA